MQSLQELVSYIRKQARAFQEADDMRVWERIQMETFREIMDFSQTEGFHIDHADFNSFVHRKSVHHEKGELHLFRKFLDIVDDLYIHHQLPKLTQHVYGIWNKQFEAHRS